MERNMNKRKEAITEGRTTLGIELGSTRIKAVLMDEEYTAIATGKHDWENRYIDNIWTYTLEDIWNGIQEGYRDLAGEVKRQYGVTITTVGAIGFSAMMHGYMAFNKAGDILVPFRTWRNTITGPASDKLTELFNYNIPQRWSIAHLYQAILNNEEHISEIDYLITLEGYVHWKLTGEKVLGIGDASGMFPVDTQTRDFNERMILQFDELVEPVRLPWKLKGILPRVLVAGEYAGKLTKEGARLLDPSGSLQPGILLCPPEGDAGTGMVATNSVAVRTGNVSAGTSVFAMVVLEHELKKVHKEIDLVVTPAGDLVAMAHSNNCTTDLDAWVSLFGEFAKSMGMEANVPKLYDVLYHKALEGDADCGGLLSYGYYSGEHITHFEEGRPLFVRKPDAKFNLANFMRVILYTALGAMKTGLDILFKEENVQVDKVLGHGGLFKTEGVGQRILAAAMNTPVSVMETAGEGGAWGIALLANYMLHKEEEETLDSYLSKVFAGREGRCVEPDKEDAEGFERFMKLYTAGLAIERAAVDVLK